MIENIRCSHSLAYVCVCVYVCAALLLCCIRETNRTSEEPKALFSNTSTSSPLEWINSCLQLLFCGLFFLFAGESDVHKRSD